MSVEVAYRSYITVYIELEISAKFESEKQSTINFTCYFLWFITLLYWNSSNIYPVYYATSMPHLCHILSTAYGAWKISNGLTIPFAFAFLLPWQETCQSVLGVYREAWLYLEGTLFIATAIKKNSSIRIKWNWIELKIITSVTHREPLLW